jgi:hypothetical protein
MIDEWFPLSSHVPLKGIEPGSLRVRARYSMEKIMPEEEYSEFKEVRHTLLMKMIHDFINVGLSQIKVYWLCTQFCRCYRR